MVEIKTLRKTCESCPSQWEGELVDGREVYARYRYAHFTFSVEGEELFGCDYGKGLDGTMETREMLGMLVAAGVIKDENKMSSSVQKHWTAESTHDFRFFVGADFIDQIERQMDAKGWRQKDLAEALGKSESWISQFFKNLGNMSLKTMIEFSSVLGLKVGMLAYDDGDEKNRRGPINSVVFQRCWELLGKPRDRWDIEALEKQNIKEGE